MHCLFAHLTTHGDPDYESDLVSDHQPVPLQLDVLMNEQSLLAIIRPDGWSVPKDLRATVHSQGVRSVGPLATLCDLINVADLFVVHDFQRFDWCMKRWRWLIGRNQEWLRKIEVFDTAQQATSLCRLPLMDGLELPDVYRTPLLLEATMALCPDDPRKGGSGGVAALYEALQSRERQAA